MQVATTRSTLAERLSIGPVRRALVPTMGALHAGHLDLVRAARAGVGERGEVVVSVFVNPLQFGPGEDLGRYPRDLEADLGALSAEGVDLVFTPDRQEMYPRPTTVLVDPGPLGSELEGASRPGHFVGVLTVVAKLFGLTRPELAVFGEKDYQQLVLVRRMSEDLDLGVTVVGMPTSREPDGLARSSRNAYLGDADRARAGRLSAALRTGQDVAAHGGAAEEVVEAAAKVLAEDGIAPDYLEVRSPNLGAAPEHGRARLLVAAVVGPTRLIDNGGLTLS